MKLNSRVTGGEVVYEEISFFLKGHDKVTDFQSTDVVTQSSSGTSTVESGLAPGDTSHTGRRRCP